MSVATTEMFASVTELPNVKLSLRSCTLANRPGSSTASVETCQRLWPLAHAPFCRPQVAGLIPLLLGASAAGAES